MTPAEKIGLAALIATVLGLVIRELHAAAMERKRTQPIVIAHERQSPRFGNQGWEALALLKNDGTGAAFNVRFGIELRGVRYAFRVSADDHPRGNKQAVINAGERLPETADNTFGIVLSSEQMWEVAALRQDGKLYLGRIYWCRYENAFGRTWETRNPWDRSADLDIRRIRFVRLRERWEQRKRRKATKVLHRVLAAIEREAAQGG